MKIEFAIVVGPNNPASINALEAERAYHRCCQHQRRVVAPAKSLDARKHEPPAVSSISSSVSGSLRSRPPPCRSDACSRHLSLFLPHHHPPTFLILLAASPGFGRCFALNIWIPRIENPVAPRGTPNDMCSSPLALLTLPSIRSSTLSPFASLSFFLSLLSFLELRWITDNFSFGKFGFNGNGCSITSLPMDEESLSVFWNGFGERFDTLLSLLVAIIRGSICLYNLDIDYLIVLLDSMFGFDGLWYFDYYSEKLYLSRRNLDFLKESF